MQRILTLDTTYSDTSLRHSLVKSLARIVFLYFDSLAPLLGLNK